MYNNWSLDVLYRGIDDPKLEADMKRLEELLGLLNKAVEALDKNDAAASLRRVIEDRKSVV